MIYAFDIFFTIPPGNCATSCWGFEQIDGQVKSWRRTQCLQSRSTFTVARRQLNERLIITSFREEKTVNTVSYPVFFKIFWHIRDYSYILQYPQHKIHILPSFILLYSSDFILSRVEVLSANFDVCISRK